MSIPDRPLLTLIDGSAYIFRAYHAVPHLSTRAGIPTNAVLGFTRMMLKALREAKSSHLAIAFDREGRTFRQAIDPEYKANRPPAPDDLIPQFALIREVVEALQVPILERQGYEADDVIATLAKRAVAEGFRVLIVTGDKDLMQLVTDEIALYDPMSERHTQPPEVLERLGVSADQVIEYMALVGDSVDNVKGVPGVGPKTASQLIQKFGTIEALLARLDEVAATGIRGAKGLGEKLAAHAEQIRMAHRLVTLKDDLEMEWTLPQLLRKPIAMGKARELFKRLEFGKLVSELPGEEASPPGSGGESATVHPEAPPLRLTLVDSEETLAALVTRLEASDAFALRCFIEDARPRTDPLVGLAFGLGEGEAWYVPLGHRYLGVSPQLREEVTLAALKPLLEAERPRKYLHGAKGDWQIFATRGITMKGVACDAELASYLLQAARREHGLEALAADRLGRELLADPRLRGAKRKSGSSIELGEVAPWIGAGVDALFALCHSMLEELDREQLAELFVRMELPLVPILAQMELTGIRVDGPRLARVDEEVTARLRTQERRIHELAGEALNINSNPQLAQVLFGRLGLPVLKKGKTGPSVDQEVLEKLALEHPLPREIIDYRGLYKLQNTYLDTLPSLIERDGRIHTSFNQAMAATGRLSSFDPNLQNIPVRTDLGRQIREAFVAEPGWKLISADYSQIELRVLAHMSHDEALLRAFEHGEDIHTRTAAETFGVDPREVTVEMRRAAKAINFGIAYGLSAFGLGQRLDLPPSHARALITQYFERYHGVRTWLDETIREARTSGWVSTMFGRKRHVPELLSGSHTMRQAGERIAVNMPIQGTAADLVKRAMIDVIDLFRKERLAARLLLQVHDELLVEAPVGEVERTRQLMRQAMENAAQLDVPLLVEVGTGDSWATAH